MNTYIFKHNGEMINEEISVEYTHNDNIIYGIIGNIYNLVDYINNNVKDNSKIKFVNFTGNKLEFIVNSVTRYRKITSVSEYYSLTVRDKKRIRGR